MANTVATHSESGAEPCVSLISNEKLIALYAAIVKCQLLEQRTTSLFQQGKLDSDLHGSTGREAVTAAIGADLQKGDVLCIAPGDWLPVFLKGVSLESFLRLLAPRLEGNGLAEAEQKNILIPQTKTSLQKLVLQRAKAAAIAKNGDIVIVIIGAGTEALKPWLRTVAAAGRNKLPVVFVHYREPDFPSSLLKARGPGAFVQGVPSIAVDAFDPVAVYRVAFEAVVRARQARGTTLLECVFAPRHSELDEEHGIRQTSSPAVAADPVLAMESYLKTKAIETEIHARQIIDGFNRDLDLATRFLGP